MTHLEIAQQLQEADESIIIVYAFNATGKTRISVAYKDVTKTSDGAHVGVYYNSYSEDIFFWREDEEDEESGIRLAIQRSSLNRFHNSLSEDNIRDKLRRYRPTYRFEFNLHKNREEGIRSITFFYEAADQHDPSNVVKVPIKVSRGEERTFVWCFFLALFDVDEWAGQQSAHFFIDDPVSSLDDHNIFVTASTILDLIEQQLTKRRIIITTHHLGLFSILADRLLKGQKASRYKEHTRLCTLSVKSGELSLETCRNDVFLYHLRLLQLLEQADQRDGIKSFHFAPLRQILENIASFLGVGQFRYVLEQIGITDANEVADIVNTLSHKKVYYFEGDELTSDSRALFDNVFTKIKDKYRFVLHA